MNAKYSNSDGYHPGAGPLQERGRAVAQVGTARIVVKGKHIDVTPALREYAEKRVAKVGKFFQHRNDVTVDVVLSVVKDSHIAEITYRLGGLILRGESRTEDLYASIDEASDKIERQVRRYKNRLQKKFHDSPRFLDEGAGTAADEALDEELPKVVRTKRFAVKPMDLQEAIMQMELLGHDFFVFANAETEEVNVVYRRKDGQFGLIEPTVEEE